MSNTIRVSIDEAKERLSEPCDAAVRGETVLIEKRDGDRIMLFQLVPFRPRTEKTG